MLRSARLSQEFASLRFPRARAIISIFNKLPPVPRSLEVGLLVAGTAASLSIAINSHLLDLASAVRPVRKIMEKIMGQLSSTIRTKILQVSSSDRASSTGSFYLENNAAVRRNFRQRFTLDQTLFFVEVAKKSRACLT